MDSGEIGVNYQGRSRFYTDMYSGSKKLPSSLKSSFSNPIALNPQGLQNLSLSSPPEKNANIRPKSKPGKNKKVGNKTKARARKAVMVADTAREAVSKASSLTLLGMKMAKAGQMMTNGTYKMPNEAFNRSFRAFEGINIAGQSIAFLKSGGETVYRAVRDLAVHNKRNEAQSLLKEYNPETRAIEGQSGSKKQERLQQLMSEKRSDLSRSKAQIAIDRLTEVTGLSEQATAITHSALLMAQSTSKLAAKSLPGLGIALTAMTTIRSAVKTGSQISALNNLAKAEAATKDPLLKALAKHIKQERTIHARTNLINTAVNFAATGVAIGFAASGVGAPAAFIATGSIGAAISVGETAFNAWHKRKLAKKRKQSDSLIALEPALTSLATNNIDVAETRKQSDALITSGSALTSFATNNIDVAETRKRSDVLIASGSALTSLATNNIGVAEKAFLAKLRHASGDELKEAINFLRNFGLTDTTIKKLQLAPEEQAVKKLREVLYQDKVKYKGLQLKQTAKTLSHVVGLSALAKRIKAGSLWLASKLKPQQKGNVTKSIAKSLMANAGR